MKKIPALFFFACFSCLSSFAQEYFTIKQYDVEIKVNKDASLDVAEIINVHFIQPRHGIIRKIPVKYELQDMPGNMETAEMQLVSGGKRRILIEDLNVKSFEFSVSTEGDYKVIKIGSEDKMVDGDQQYIISYRVINAINFFKDYSEFYFNVIGNQWNTQIDKVNFKITLYKPLTETPVYFVATGPMGSKENNTSDSWENNGLLNGTTTQALKNNEGLTVGIRFPVDYLLKPELENRGKAWLALPFAFLAAMFLIWKRWGKDKEVTVQTEFYPPENVSPSVSGYVIDNRLDRRELTALVPYWGAAGFLQVNELEEKALFGLIKTKDYEFVKLRDIPVGTLAFEKTIFNGIFNSGDTVKLSSLKNVLYTTMAKARKELLAEIKKEDYYVPYSRGFSCAFPLVGFIILVAGGVYMVADYQLHFWPAIGIMASGILMIIFGALMTKKTKKGTALYQKLLGFKEFIKSVEKDRLEEFLKQDEHYFDKILPYAIVFDMADAWKDKLKGLDVPPPSWYHGNYAGAHYNTAMFMSSLDKGLDTMSSSFYSAPSSSGSSGGSFGGGGSSGGGFGGGGGSSW